MVLDSIGLTTPISAFARDPSLLGPPIDPSPPRTPRRLVRALPASVPVQVRLRPRASSISGGVFSYPLALHVVHTKF